MAFDLGDTIPLPFLTKDPTGALADIVTTAVLTITLPDTTTVTPAVTHVTTGTYVPAVPYISTQPGIHKVSWVGSGTNAQDYTDTFNVMAADPGFIISLADARAGIGYPLANTTNDEDLRTYVAAATPVMEDLIGSILRVPRTDTYDGGRSQIVLLWTPLISVTSVIESYGTFERILNLENIFDGSAIDAYGYTIELDTGLLTRRIAGRVAPFPPGRRNVQVVYTSGRAALKGNHLLATRIVVRQMWQADQQGYRPTMGAPDADLVPTPSGFLVPRRAAQLCAGDIRNVGVA
jgi:hypothetical protein